MINYDDIKLENKDEICNYIKMLLYVDRVDMDIIISHVSMKYGVSEEEVNKCIMYIKYSVLK